MPVLQEEENELQWLEVVSLLNILLVENPGWKLIAGRGGGRWIPRLLSSKEDPLSAAVGRGKKMSSVHAYPRGGMRGMMEGEWR